MKAEAQVHRIGANYVVALDHMWLPGVYASEDAACLAASLSEIAAERIECAWLEKLAADGPATALTEADVVAMCRHGALMQGRG